MLKVVARTRVKEGCMDAYCALARELVAETRKESGNIFYTLNQSAEDKSLVAMLEAWQDRAALEAHFASEHFQRIVPQFAPLAAESFPVEIYEELI